MLSDRIFSTLAPDVLQQIAEYLKWDPLVSSSPTKLLSQSDSHQRLTWLHAHRTELERQISWVGTPIFSYALGNAKNYQQIIADVTTQVGAQVSVSMSTGEMEAALLQKLWNDTLSRLTREERSALLDKVEELSAEYRPSAKKELIGFASLAAAQMSGFGVYVLGSTLLGAVNSALGLGLGFGAFTGLSSAISIVIGPVGWAGLGLYTIKKLGAPNYKKLLPVVILVASQRAGALNAPQFGNGEVTAQQKKQIEHSEPHRWNEQQERPSRASAARVTVSPQIRRYSRTEKTAFQLRPENRALCQITEELFPGIHFLELPDNDREVIRELKEWRDQAEAEERLAAEQRAVAEGKEAQKQRKRAEVVAGSVKRQNWKKDVTAKRSKDYSRLLPNLAFDPDAIERLEQLAKAGAVGQIDGKLGLMNLGKVVYRDSISGTDPTVYEEKAGYDYRVYFVRNGSKIRVCLVGDKGTQDADIAQLRRNTRSHAAGL